MNFVIDGKFEYYNNILNQSLSLKISNFYLFFALDVGYNCL